MTPPTDAAEASTLVDADLDDMRSHRRDDFHGVRRHKIQSSASGSSSSRRHRSPGTPHHAPTMATIVHLGSMTKKKNVRIAEDPSEEVMMMIGKKVEVSLRLFDIFERNRVFIFLWGSWESPPTDRGLQ